MELIKENESFKFSETKPNGWNLTGNVSKTTLGDINMNFNISASELDTNIGSGYYNRDANGNVNSNYSVTEVNETEFVDYMQESIKVIIKQLNAQ